MEFNMLLRLFFLKQGMHPMPPTKWDTLIWWWIRERNTKSKKLGFARAGMQQQITLFFRQSSKRMQHHCSTTRSNCSSSRQDRQEEALERVSIPLSHYPSLFAIYLHLLNSPPATPITMFQVLNWKEARAIYEVLIVWVVSLLLIVLPLEEGSLLSYRQDYIISSLSSRNMHRSSIFLRNPTQAPKCTNDLTSQFWCARRREHEPLVAKR